MSALTYCRLEIQARRLIKQRQKQDIGLNDFMQEVSLLADKARALNLKGEMVIE